jgi:hypothetical protein
MQTNETTQRHSQVDRDTEKKRGGAREETEETSRPEGEWRRRNLWLGAPKIGDLISEDPCEQLPENVLLVLLVQKNRKKSCVQRRPKKSFSSYMTISQPGNHFGLLGSGLKWPQRIIKSTLLPCRVYKY